MAAPGPPGFDGRAMSDEEEVPEDGAVVFEVTAAAAFNKRVGMGSVAGIKVGIDVRSIFGYAAAQLNEKPHPVKSRKESQTTNISTKPINTP